VSCRKDPVRGAADRPRPPVENMRVDHGCADIVVAQELLDRSDVVPIVQQMGGEGVAEGVAAHALGDTRAEGGDPDRALQDRFVQMMTDVFSVRRL
jgi:hypothetical protein